MKDKLKNTLEHEVELLGRSISILAVAGLLIAGGASASLLTSFGTVTGTANVDQAVVVDDSTGVATVDIFETDSITAGATTVDTFEITNNLDSEYSPVYDSELTVADSDDSDSTTIEETGSNVNWQDDSDEQVGIDTTYADYFSDAGHDFSDVEDEADSADITVDNDEGDDSDSDDIYATISTALDNAKDDDVIYVENPSDDGAYDGFTMDVEGVSVVSNGATVEGDVVINANEFRLSGFNVEDTSDDNNDIIRVNTNVATDGEISNVLVEGVGKGSTDDPTGTAIYLNHQNAASNVEIHDNTFDNAYAGVGGTESFEGSIDNNVFKSNNEAIAVGDDEFSTEGNRFEDNEASFRIYKTGPYEGDSVDADNNFFAEPFNIDYNGNEDVTDVSASYETVDSVPSGETVTVGIVNDFDLMINGAYDYSLTTDITTSEATE